MAEEAGADAEPRFTSRILRAKAPAAASEDRNWRAEPGSSLEAMAKPLVLDQLTKYYGPIRGIEDLSLEVNEGEVFGFLGPNGAGKSTTISTILDFIRPTRGTATVLGLDSRRDSVSIHRQVGYLPGELAMPERMTGRELLGYLAALRNVHADREIEALADRFPLL